MFVLQRPSKMFETPWRWIGIRSQATYRDHPLFGFSAPTIKLYLDICIVSKTSSFVFSSLSNEGIKLQAATRIPRDAHTHMKPKKAEEKREKSRKHTKRHTHTNIRILHHPCKLLKTDLPVPVQIGLHDGLVDDLLQLHILEIATDHHLEDDEQFAVGDVAVAIDVVDFEGEAQFFFFVAFGREGREARDEFLEIDIAPAVFVEDRYHSRRRGVSFVKWLIGMGFWD